MFSSIDNFLTHPGLYLLIHLRISQTEHQSVGPFLSYDSQLRDDSLIMISIVETLYMFFLCLIDETRLEILHRSIDHIIIIGIILKSVDFPFDTILESLTCVYRRAMSVERAVRIGSVGEPGATSFVGDNIYHATDGIRAEAYRNHTSIYFYAFCEIDRNIVERERAAHAFLRHAIYEHLDMFSGESVEHHRKVGANATRLAHL